MLPGLAAVLLAYGVGMLPSAQLVARRLGRDPTSEGSGNPGASNVLRIAGRRAGAAVLVLDAAKGAAPTGIALALSGRSLAAACWTAAALGHVFPVVRRFRGGKGVATVAGGAVVLFPLLALGFLAVFVAVAALGRRPSVASLTVAVLLPVAVAVTGHPGWETMVAGGLATLVVFRHADNIRRLFQGEERAIRG